jgi:hypothetical protein
MNKDIEYYKTKLLKFLKKKYIDDEGLKKSKEYPVGTVRSWKGNVKMKKVGPKRWKKVYEGTGTKGEIQSLRNVIKEINNATTISKLSDIVNENIDRFKDKNGNLSDSAREIISLVKEKKNKSSGFVVKRT